MENDDLSVAIKTEEISGKLKIHIPFIRLIEGLGPVNRNWELVR